MQDNPMEYFIVVGKFLMAYLMEQMAFVDQRMDQIAGMFFLYLISVMHIVVMYCFYIVTELIVVLVVTDCIFFLKSIE